MLALLLCLAPLSPVQNTWYVDAAASGPGTGDPSDPYVTIQSAVDAGTTVEGDTILVRNGRYTEAVVIDGKGLSLSAAPGNFSVVLDRVNVIGTPCLTVRNVAAPGVNVDGFQFTQDTSVPALGHAVDIEAAFFSMARSTITSFDFFGSSGGGGALVGRAGATVSIVGCTFTSCEASEHGGAIAFSGDSLSVDACSFTGCEVFYQGGAIWFDGTGTLDINQSLFLGNQAAIGGAICVTDAAGGSVIRGSTFRFNGNPGTNTAGGIFGHGTVEGCVFERNLGQESGAAYGSWAFSDSVFDNNGGSDSGNWTSAVYGAPRSSLTDCIVRNHRGGGGSVPSSAVINSDLVRCVFENNRTIVDEFENFINGAGAISDCTAVDCVFTNNRTISPVGTNPQFTGRGGAAFRCDLTNCVFTGNLAPLGGAAYDCNLVGCTMVGNEADLAGGAVGAGTMDSCIAYGNFPDELTDGPTVTWSCVEGGAPGQGNIAAAPSFWGPASGDFQLQAGSPCIDTGNPMLSDPDGSRRDMGAVPYDAMYAGEPTGFCPPGFDSNGCAPTLSSISPPSASGLFQFRASGIDQASVSLSFLATASQSVPYQNGDLCIGGAVRRGPLGLRTLGQSGPCSDWFDFILTPSDLFLAGFVPGDRLYAQVVYRDSGSAQGVGITGALEAIVRP